VTSASFSVRADVKASNPFFALGQACPPVFDPSHSNITNGTGQEQRGRGLLYSDCGTG